MKYILLMLLLVGCSSIQKPRYKKGDCLWHSRHKEERHIYKITDEIYLEGKHYYIYSILNFEYNYNFKAYGITSSNYFNRYHPSLSHEEKCRNGIRKDLIEKCIKDKNFIKTTGGMKCPTKEEYLNGRKNNG